MIPNICVRIASTREGPFISRPTFSPEIPRGDVALLEGVGATTLDKSGHVARLTAVRPAIRLCIEVSLGGARLARQMVATDGIVTLGLAIAAKPGPRPTAVVLYAIPRPANASSGPEDLV